MNLVLMVVMLSFVVVPQVLHDGGTNATRGEYQRNTDILDFICGKVCIELYLRNTSILCILDNWSPFH